MTPPQGLNGASSRAEAAARTRRALLDAGLRLAGEGSLGALRTDRVVAEAGLSKGTFFHHFGTREAYINELLRDFYDELAATVLDAMAVQKPGAGRMLSATNAYLDGCAGNPGARALLLEARSDPSVATAITERNLAFAQVLAEDFAALGSSHPLERGQLWVGTTAEAAILEHHAGKPLPAIRAALAEALTGRRER
ncbi:MAG: TetR/AcrR family transcriptional regulator [Patulibacter sp.]